MLDLETPETLDLGFLQDLQRKARLGSRAGTRAWNLCQLNLDNLTP